MTSVDDCVTIRQMVCDTVRAKICRPVKYRLSGPWYTSLINLLTELKLKFGENAFHCNNLDCLVRKLTSCYLWKLAAQCAAMAQRVSALRQWKSACIMWVWTHITGCCSMSSNHIKTSCISNTQHTNDLDKPTITCCFHAQHFVEQYKFANHHLKWIPRIA